MQIKQIQYSRKFNLGNYETEDISYVAELDEEDNPDKAMAELILKVSKVEKFLLKLRTSESPIDKNKLLEKLRKGEFE